MKDKLIIIGASGHGKVVADIALKMDKWKSIEFLDDNENITTCMGIKVLGTTEDGIKYKEQADFFVAIGNNTIREIIQSRLEANGFSIVKLIHPNAVIGVEVEIGKGTVVMAGAVINSSTKIGKGCILNTSCSLDHDNIIEDYVHISPGANLAGTVRVGEKSWIGIGSIVINNLNIEKNCIIGAGSTVLKDLTENCVVGGSPATPIKSKNNK